MTRRFALALLVGLNAVMACTDPVDPPEPAAAEPVSTLAQGVTAGTAVPQTPSVLVTTERGRPVQGIRVRFTVVEGDGVLTDPEPVTGSDGVARVGSWTLGAAPGPNRVTATVDGLPGVQIAFEAMSLPEGCTDLVPLDLAMGDLVRVKSTTATAWPCLLYDAAASAGNEYVLLLENISPSGGFSSSLFAGPAGDTSFAFTVSVDPLLRTAASATPGHASAEMVALMHAVAEPAAHAWDFGAGRIREHIPAVPPPGMASVELLRGDRTMDMNHVLAVPAVGDTIQVLMEAIPHLGTSTQMQKAVIRFVTDELIIAEDIRLTTTLQRQRGGFNTPLTEADMAAIAAEYNAVARVQGDLLFQNRHNLAVENESPRRVTAVHSIMPAEDVWGYTYSVSNYFVWDYWVATDGFTKGLNQHPQRVADNLFMHEIAHMRHMGMLQHGGRSISARGHRWLVEGFARFAERLPTTSRILGTTTPSRTQNIVLPRNPEFGNAYFLDDVPTYLKAGASVYHGYDASSFVFDYFADQVSLAGGDWMTAVREFVLAAASADELEVVVQKWLPGVPVTDLITRARIALYTDDLGVPGLPSWTQYHQFQLRASRPAPSHLRAEDPREKWPSVSATMPGGVMGAISAGAATGLIITGSDTGAGVIRLGGPAGRHAIAALARIR